MRRFEPGKNGYLILLCALLALLVLRPVLTELGASSWLLPLFVTGVLMASVWAVARRRHQLVVLVLIVLVVLLEQWTRAAGQPLMPLATGPLLSLIFFGWVALILAIDVFSRRVVVNADLIYGGVNVYLLIGLSFASAYRTLSILSPAAINGLDGSDLAQAVYFSFVTLTTLGYGDITPLSETAHMLAYLEALFGQLYVAVLLARLVAMQMSHNKA